MIALLLIAALVTGVFAVNVGRTYAAPADIVVTLQNERPDLTADVQIEVGQSRNYQVAYLNQAASSDTATATVTYTSYQVGGPNGINGIMNVTGVKAGLANLAFGNKQGLISAFQFLIIDSNNVSAYRIKEGAAIYFNDPKGAAGVAKASPVTVTTGQFSRITWSSMHPSIATVSTTGAITPVKRGVTLVIGTFIDKWGTPRDMHILVSVGVFMDDANRLGELLELIKRGEEILAERENGQSPYSDATMQELQNAVNEGKSVVNSTNPTDQQIDNAIERLKNAIKNMKKKLGPGVIEGDDGNYYKQVQDNVFEEVNRDGSSKYNPPRYVWGGPDRKPGTADDKEAILAPGGYYVEDPPGSNIWKPVGPNGMLNENGAIWGGPDGRPGGGDDMPVTKFVNDYWVNMGQNIWRKVVQPRELGPLTGGGPTGNPASYNVTPIFDNTAKDGKYYVGPLGPDSTGNQYYYGDGPGGNGKVDSTAGQLYFDDVKYYRDSNGNMVTTDPSIVTNVVINPQVISLPAGTVYTFTATAYRSDGAVSAQGVTWSVTPTSGGASINANGVLTIPAGETNTPLIVRATSLKTNTVYGTATVTVTNIGPDPNAINRVEISPSSTSITRGSTQQFTAKVFRNNNTEEYGGVTWTVTGSNGSSSVNSYGVLTVGAGETANSLTVRATSNTNSSIYSTAYVTVTGSDPNAIGRVEISPTSASVTRGSTQQFTAKVFRNNNTEEYGGVSWSVTGSNGSSSINTSGVLTVGTGETASSLTVRATSNTNTSIYTTVQVTVTGSDPNAINRVEISPSSTTVNKGSTQQFTAKVFRNNNSEDYGGVSWSVSGSNGSSSISSYGVLTVGSGETASSLTVRATSNTNTSIYSTAYVTVPGSSPIARVVVTPSTVTVTKQASTGAPQQFTAKVYKNDNSEDFGGVTWTVIGSNGASSIDSNGLLVIASWETSTSLTTRATSKTNPSIYGTAQVTVTSAISPGPGGGLPGLKECSIGSIIRIDGIDWIKVREGKHSGTNTSWCLLLMKSVISPATTYASSSGLFDSYSNTTVRSCINNWYYYASMPTLKKYALTPEIYSANPTSCLGTIASSGYNYDVAFCPKKADISGTYGLSNSQLLCGYDWWTSSKSTDSKLFGFLEVFTSGGLWSWLGFGYNSVYARPAIYVMC